MIRKKKVTTLLLATASLVFCAPLKAQEEGQRWNVTASGGAGYMLHEPERFDNLTRSFWYPTADLRMGYYTCSDDPLSFASLYDFPNIGFGVNWKGTSHFDWVGQSHLSDLLSLYGFIERDFIRTRKFSFGYNFSLGVAFNSAVYDKNDNPENIIFSSAALVYLAPGLHLEFRPTPHLQLGLSGVLTHMSTGRLAYHNAGFNGVDVVASARYAMAEPRIPERKGHEKPAFQKRMLYEVFAGYGAHRCAQEFEATGKTSPWPTYTLGTSACYQYKPTLSSGLGLDFFFFPKSFLQSVASSERILHPKLNPEEFDYRPLSMGISAVQQLHYGNFTAWFQVGVYLYKHLGVAEQDGILYQRIGGKIVFPKLANTYLGFSCKSHHFSRAASLDFILGVRI